MKDNIMKNNDLWGEGLPYSEAIIQHENRIIDDGVTRRVCRVFAKINPGTIKLLLQNKAKINDTVIHRLLNEMTPDDSHDGFNWYVYQDEAPYSTDPEKILKELTENIIHIHKVATRFLNV